MNMSRNRYFLPASAFLMANLLAWSALAASDGLSIRPIIDATQGEAPRLAEIGASEAVINFTSSIALACTVVYGETPAYGRITNDPDMSATATIDHRPVLGDLKPDTMYHFRVQGVSLDGTLYLGEQRTFRTAKAVATKANLALGAKVVAVSSNYGGGANSGAWGANSALDGKRSTAWSSSGDGDDAFVEIDLGSPQEITAADVWTRTMSDGTAQIFTFTITTAEGEKFGPYTLPDANKPYRFDLPVTTQRLRLEALKTSGGNTGLVEFQVFGK